jgi:hypothetical protein
MAELTRVRVSRWVVAVDLDATRAAFAELAASDVPETGCDCGHCRNFAASFPAPYPPEALELLKQLGMDARYPSEVVYYCRTENQPGRHFYGGWFHFVGEILEGQAMPEKGYDRLDEHGNWVRAFEPLGEHFKMFFTTSPLPLWKVFNGRPVVALEFETTVVPWVLDEHAPDY